MSIVNTQKGMVVLHFSLARGRLSRNIFVDVEDAKLWEDVIY